MADPEEIDDDFVHEFALAAMNGILSSDNLSASVQRTAIRKGRGFVTEVSIQSYDMAEAMMLEAEARS